jgi:UDP:flavonoid glycosyltransferase YjiC (YdhE family)
MVGGNVASILICSIPARGHLHPALALTAELQRSGHDVRLAALPQDAGPAQAAGAKCLFLNDEGQPSAWIAANRRWVAGLLRFQPLPGFAAGLFLAAFCAALAPWLLGASAPMLATTAARVAGFGLGVALAALAYSFFRGFPRSGVMVDRYVFETFQSFASRHFDMLERTPALHDFSPDLVIVDSLAYGAALWCERHDYRWIGLCMFPGALHGLRNPPYTGWGLAPLETGAPFWRRWEYCIVEAWIAVASRWLAKKMRARWRRDPRLAPLVDGLQIERLNCMSPRLNLCFTHSYLEYGRETGWPAAVRLAGPALFDGHCVANEPWLGELAQRIDEARGAGKRIVYVTFGTIWFARRSALFTRLVGALARDSRFLVVATTGDAAAAGRVQAAVPAALAFRSVPNSWLIPQIDLMVHHGGFSTALEPALLGKPAVVVPVGVIDNAENAARLAHIGVAWRPPSRWRWLPGRWFDRAVVAFVSDRLNAWESRRDDASHPHRRLLAALNAEDGRLGELRNSGARRAVGAIEALLAESLAATPAALGGQPSSVVRP